MKNNTTVVLRMGNANRSVHVNRVRPLLEEDTSRRIPSDWVPPLFSNEPAPLVDVQEDCDLVMVNSESLPEPSEVPYVTRSGRVVRPVQRYGVTTN